ncbi:hypothetical protein SLS54_002631 [Diplodia seriata]
MVSAWAKFEDVAALRAPGVRHLHGRVVSVDCAKKSAVVAKAASGEQIEEPYDFLIVGSGLRRAWPVVPQSLDKASYLAEDRALAVLREAGVETILGRRVLDTVPVDGASHVKLSLSDGSTLIAGQVVNAISKSVPTSSFLPKDILDDEGYVKVQASLRFPADVPNAEYHYAAGDIVRWSGIKRCGAAMHMGQYAAQNIHAHMLRDVAGVDPAWKELGVIPPMIGLAVAKKAVVYDPDEGTSDGEHLLKSYFGQDLGHQSE